MRKRIFVHLIFIGIVIIFLNKPVYAGNVSFRTDSTILYDGQSYFPIGFWPTGADAGMTSTDWQDLASNGINLGVYELSTGKNPCVLDANRQCTINGVKAFYASVAGGGVAYRIATEDPGQVATDIFNDAAKYVPNLLAYYGVDEPVGNYFGENPWGWSINPELYGGKDTRLYTFFNRLNELDHNKVWTNFASLFGSGSNCAYNSSDTDQRCLSKYWDAQTNTKIAAMDYYDWDPSDASGVWQWSVILNDFIKNQILPTGYSGEKSGLMIINGFYSFRGFSSSSPTFIPDLKQRFNLTLQAIVGGANGFIFYIACDGTLDNFVDPYCTHTQGQTPEQRWQTYKTTSAYTQVKTVAKTLNSVMPGLVGTKVEGLTSCSAASDPLGGNDCTIGKVLAKRSADNKLYLFAVHVGPNQRTITISGLPSDVQQLEEIGTATNSGSVVGIINVSSGSFTHTMPGYGTKIFKQKTDITTSTPIPIYPTSTLTPTCDTRNRGDANCDGKADGIDYSIWLNNQCPSTRPANAVCAGTQADFNGDGNVDDADIDIWMHNHSK